MFAVIGTETVPRRSFAARAAERLGGRDYYDVYEDSSLGARVLRADISFPYEMRKDKRRKLVRKALACVASAGVRGVVLPSDFAYSNELERFGLVAAEPAVVFRRIAGKLAAYAIKSRGMEGGELICALFSRRLTRTSAKAAREICLHARYLALCCGQEISVFCRELARDYGASVMENPSARLLAGAGVMVVLDTPENGLPDAGDGSVIIRLDREKGILPPRAGIVADGARLRVPKRLARAMPDCRTESLLAALVAAGTVGEDELEVEALTKEGAVVL